MVVSSFYPLFWLVLIALDVIVARKLFIMYRKDGDVQKIMFAVGLLMCMPIYALAIIGINSFPYSINVFSWSALPILLAFIFTILGDTFSFDLKKAFRLFIVGTLLTFVLFFVPLQSFSLMFLFAGGAFAIFLSIFQCSKKFNIASVLLFLAIPSFAIVLAGIDYNLIELAIFGGFVAKAFLLLTFEASKRQMG